MKILDLEIIDGIKAKPCVGSGLCCQKGPCGFGESISKDDPCCKHLKQIETNGRHPRFTCGIAESIVGSTGWEVAPAFGAGCCMSLFNKSRQAILREIASSDDPHGHLTLHHNSNL